PEAIIKNLSPKRKHDPTIQGKESIGALRFRPIALPPGKTKRYIILMGITNKETPQKTFKKFNSKKKIDSSLSANKTFWMKKINAINLNTKDKEFDAWIKWVTLQPELRKIFGCSFLPDFDYGRGGRGWRDLWQDCLTLLLINPKDARKTLINNFGGVRRDGSNATIIGKKDGEFSHDRNNIPRVWMDHGLWPFVTLNLYINQTGDKNILFANAPYFETKKIGSVLKHILVEHKRPFSKLGKHGIFRLEGADWNDGLDMATERGESVAFTAAYVGNLINLSDLLERTKYNPKVIDGLRRKIKRLRDRIREREWIKTRSGYSFFNGYYDNKGKRVEGDHKNGVRMTLTGQVFPIMSGVATEKQIKAIYRSAKKYLWDSKLQGFRL
ncbi:MAG: cellobiose phosphorylase, partial [Candidatus Omnitrophota bacterium]|nr:cellobiose phosphorylase [Candidatus Omnitrophota bacterium]